MTNVNSTAFRFENLLHLRESIRDQKKNELAFLLARQEKLFVQKRALELAVEEIQNKRRQSQKEGPIDISEQIQYTNQLGWMNQEKETLLEQIRDLENSIEEKRTELEAAMQELKIMENLREKDEEKKVELVRRSESNQLDEQELNRRNS